MQKKCTSTGLQTKGCDEQPNEPSTQVYKYKTKLTLHLPTTSGRCLWRVTSAPLVFPWNPPLHPLDPKVDVGLSEAGGSAKLHLGVF